MIAIYRHNLCRGSVFGTQTITTREDLHCVKLAALQCGNYIQIQRLTQRTWLLRSVKNRNLFHGIRNRCNQSFRAEWTIQTNFHHTNLSAGGLYHVIDSLLDGVINRTHRHDHMLSIWCTIIVEQLIIRTNLSVYLVHVLLHNPWQRIIIWVAGFSCLEENIRVLCRTSLARMIRIQSMFAERSNSIPVSHLSQVIIIPSFNLLNLVRSTETIKKVNKWNLTFNCRQMSHRA